MDKEISEINYEKSIDFVTKKEIDRIVFSNLESDDIKFLEENFYESVESFLVELYKAFVLENRAEITEIIKGWISSLKSPAGADLSESQLKQCDSVIEKFWAIEGDLIKHFNQRKLQRQREIN